MSNAGGARTLRHFHQLCICQVTWWSECATRCMKDTGCRGFSFKKTMPCGTADCNLALNNATHSFSPQYGSHYFERKQAQTELFVFNKHQMALIKVNLYEPDSAKTCLYIVYFIGCTRFFCQNHQYFKKLVFSFFLTVRGSKLLV